LQFECHGGSDALTDLSDQAGCKENFCRVVVMSASDFANASMTNEFQSVILPPSNGFAHFPAKVLTGLKIR
jgi:hypothetical protein